MKVLVTGSKGFVGKNLIKQLKTIPGVEEILEYDKENSFEDLKESCRQANAVFHLAGVLRPQNEAGFETNVDLTTRILDYLQAFDNRCPIMFSSSIQAELDNPYGRYKRVEEGKIIDASKGRGTNAYIFRFPNLFGTMSRPNYTSVVATFCYNTVKGLPITVNNPAAQMKFAFVEPVMRSVIQTVLGNNPEQANQIITFDNYYTVGLGELAYYMETLKREQESRIRRDDDFYQKLQETYLWYTKNYTLYDPE